MLKGTVKWFNDLKGYGFITSTDLPREVYVRFTEIISNGYRTLKAGDQVAFELEDVSGSPKATNVVKY